MPRRLRIVLDARHLQDFGYGTYIRNLLAALAEVDCENEYLLTGSSADAVSVAHLPGNFRWVPYRRPDTSPIDNLLYPLFLSRLAPDLVHIPLNAVPMALPRPYIVTLHDLSSLLFSQRTAARQPVSVFRFRRGLLRASRVIAVSQSTRRDAEQLLHIPPSRISQVYSAPDPVFLSGPPPLETVKRVLERFQIDYPFLLYAGAVRPQKNIARLVEAFAVLKGDLEGHPEWRELRLIIIGDNLFQHPSVRRTVIQSRVEHCVRFLGFVSLETLRVFYAQATAFVFPSLYEGFGLAPLEAMASGTPVITSNVSSLPEVVGDAAVMVNPENVFDISRGMHEVLVDPELRRQLQARGRQQVARFSWQETARQVLEAYRQAVGG